MTKAQQPTDLSSFAALQQSQDDGVPVSIVNPINGDELGMTIVVAGQDSKVYRVAKRNMMTDRFKAKRMKLEGEEVEREAKKLVAACVVSWSGVVEDGKPLECSVGQAMYVFDKYPWLYEQVEAVHGDRASFLKS